MLTAACCRPALPQPSAAELVVPITDMHPPPPQSNLAESSSFYFQSIFFLPFSFLSASCCAAGGLQSFCWSANVTAACFSLRGEKRSLCCTDAALIVCLCILCGVKAVLIFIRSRVCFLPAQKPLTSFIKIKVIQV